MHACLRCNHTWEPRKQGRPIKCPRCTSTSWDKEKKSDVKLEGRGENIREGIDNLSYDHDHVINNIYHDHDHDHDNKLISIEKEKKTTWRTKEKKEIAEHELIKIPPKISKIVEKIAVDEFVHLSEDQILRLKEKFGEETYKEYVIRLNLYKGSHGKKYKSDYHTILNWNRGEDKEPTVTDLISAEFKKMDKSALNGIVWN